MTAEVVRIHPERVAQVDERDREIAALRARVEHLEREVERLRERRETPRGWPSLPAVKWSLFGGRS